MNKGLIASILLLGSALPLSGYADTAAKDTPVGDAVAGKTKSTTCVACHGADGNSASGAFPSIAGQHAKYIQNQLEDYRSGARQNAMMAPVAQALSDQDILDLASYFASQTSQGRVAGAQHEAGAAIYRGGVTDAGIAACAGCHGPAGKGNPGAAYPRLAGQHADYTAAQLKAFRDGSRSNDESSMMRAIAKRMSDAEIDAVADFVQGLQ